jgi:predicted Rossmann fold flavoprotein
MRPQPNNSTLAIIGAGPAGLLAALSAARQGSRVIVFEKLLEAGARLLATGGGHCNFTNTLDTPEFIRRFGAQSRFVAPAIKALPPGRLRKLFEELGVTSHNPDGFHVLPKSESALTVRDALLQTCQQQGVAFRFNSRVDRLQTDQGRVSGVLTGAGLEPAARVILAAGGASHPELGGGESGFNLARLAGHSLQPLCPALVPLLTRETWPATLAGVTLPQVAANLPNCADPRAVARGGLLFTHQGVSGPAVLDISGLVAAELLTGSSVAIELDLAPDRSTEALRAELANLKASHGARLVSALLAPILPAALAHSLIELASVSPNIPLARASREQICRLIKLLKNLPLTVTGTEGFGKAMATRGGISRDEVNPKTLESKLVCGLFFAGEVLDVDGPCGGFNLQWAFASGRLAGLAATER